MAEYTICSKCIVDSIVHPSIKLDEHGVCDICHIYDSLILKEISIKENKDSKLNALLEQIKVKAQNKEYDCIIGLSGGVDSAYLCIKAKEWGLRPLLLHIDNGWNSELAVYNIEKIVDYTGFDLYTYVVKWTEIRDLVNAYLQASVIDIDIANEMPFMAMLYKIASKFNIQYILTGHNVVTEGWMPLEVSFYKLDTLNVKDIHKQFGKIPLQTYPFIGPIKKWYYEKVLRISMVSPLNYIDYNKDEVKEYLKKTIGWIDYGAKHYENIFTRFYQGYILLEKFKIDKRKFHFSNLILSGQMTREEALQLLQTSPYSSTELLRDDREFVMKKLHLSNDEFHKIMQTEPKSHLDYKSYIYIYKILSKIKRAILK